MAPTMPIDYTGQREYRNFSRMVLGDVMGKQRKASKGYSSGVVPDYPNAVEAVAESEGFGSSDRVRAMLAASLDSCAPCRKWISLNADDYGSSVVPVKLFSLSKMSPMERRHLEAKLKMELCKVRMLQSKIASFSVGAVMHPSTAVHSYQNESGKKKWPPGKSGPRTKGGAVAARKNELTKQNLPHSTNFVMFMKQCETLLARLMQHQHAWIFNEPVDIVKHNIPDYFNVIKHPMDLGTVKRKLLSNEYSSPVEFATDVRLTFKNAMTYNPPGHDVHVMAEIMSKHFEVRWKSIEKKLPLTADESTASKSSVIVEPERACVPPTKKQKTLSGEKKTRKERDKWVMSDDDKQKLGVELEALLAELPDNIVNFLKDSTSNGVVSEDEIEIDIDSLSDDTLFTLRKLLADYLQEKQRKQVGFQPSEAEMQKEYRFSSISDQLCKDKEPADEDVEIGGNDAPPIYSSSPTNNDRDATQRGSNDSQSSSSESGTSSTDTDSESSGSEVEGTKNVEPVTTGTIDTSAGQKEMELRVSNCGALGTAEQNSVSNSSSIELNCQGENAHPQRQVSPEKLYRAALLRGRFADIIIKAQENTLEKGEKPDTEKLKLEREEVERRRREEKARLQAEAKAAEEARIKAVAEAVAEAKRNRELEREAARQALQKMEKTVDINENSQFMEDLEMFKSGPDENVQVFIEDASPENSQNGLGSFNFRASSNPLEQLGLYMKNDEEEEEVEPENPMEASHDPEEGEID